MILSTYFNSNARKLNNRSLGHLHLQKQRSLGKHRLKEYQRDKRYEYFADKKRNKGYVRHELPI